MPRDICHRGFKRVPSHVGGLQVLEEGCILWTHQRDRNLVAVIIKHGETIQGEVNISIAGAENVAAK
jgi:hypothetical protein